jgi:hypothetical protein
LPSPSRSPKAAPKLTPLLVEAPGRADVLEPQVAQVAEGQVLLGQDRARLLDEDRSAGVSASLAGLEVGVVQLAVHPVRHEEVEAAVVVEVLEAHRPGPVGRGEAREARGLEAAARPVLM